MLSTEYVTLLNSSVTLSFSGIFLSAKLLGSTLVCGLPHLVVCNLRIQELQAFLFPAGCGFAAVCSKSKSVPFSSKASSFHSQPHLGWHYHVGGVEEGDGCGSW